MRVVSSFSFEETKMRVVIPFFFSFFIFFSLSAQKPGWISNYWRAEQYTNADYFKGFVSLKYQPGTDADAVVQEAISMSRQQLSHSIQSMVKTRSAFGAGSLSESSIEVLNELYVTKDLMDKVGFTTESYLDNDQNTGYAFTYIGKRKLQAGYYKLFSTLVKDMNSRLPGVKEEPDLEKRFEGFKQLNLDMNKARGMRDMLVALGIRNDVVLMTNEWKSLNFEIDAGINKIRSSEDLTIDQSIRFFVEEMADELDDKYKTVLVNPLTFENSGIATEFSEFFKEHLSTAMNQEFELTNDPETTYRMTGSYWVSGNKVRLTMNIHEYDGDERIFLIHGGAMNLDKSLVDALGLPYEVDENMDLDKHFEILSTGEMDGGIKAVVTTQKGNKSLVFKEGEELKLFINVSMPSYIRLINIWSDGTQLSLLENYYIPDAEVNQQIELPFEWQTACPCGVEYIKIVAQNKPFEPIDLRSEDGLDYIETDITEIMANTRRVQSSLTTEKDFFYGEDGFSITTMQQ